MPLITDLDLLALDAALFIDAQNVGIMLDERDNASISGSTLTSPDSDFSGIELDDSHVAVVQGEPLEVISVLGGTSVTVSRQRPSKNGPLLMPKAGADLALQIVTFQQRIAHAENTLRQALAIDTDDPLDPISDAQVLNLNALRPVVALMTTADVYQRAAAHDPDDATLAQRAALYGVRRAKALRTASAVLDLDNDGQADAMRRLDAITPRRA